VTYWKDSATGKTINIMYSIYTHSSTGETTTTAETVSISGSFPKDVGQVSIHCLANYGGLSKYAGVKKCSDFGINISSSASQIGFKSTPVTGTGQKGGILNGTLTIPGGTVGKGGGHTDSGPVTGVPGGGGTPPSGGTPGGNCGIGNYAGPKDDPAVWTFCAEAYNYRCLGGVANNASADKICKLLNATFQQVGDRRTAGSYCPSYCKGF